METNQLKCSIIYKKIVMRAGHDERIINHKWPKEPFFYHNKHKKLPFVWYLQMLYVQIFSKVPNDVVLSNDLVQFI